MYVKVHFASRWSCSLGHSVFEQNEEEKKVQIMLLMNKAASNPSPHKNILINPDLCSLVSGPAFISQFK